MTYQTDDVGADVRASTPVDVNKEEAWNAYWDSLPQKQRIKAIPQKLSFFAGWNAAKKEKLPVTDQNFVDGIQSIQRAARKIAENNHHCGGCTCQKKN